MPRRGLFITFEGPDGTGKTTQIERLAEWLRARNCDLLATREPGGTAMGERVRALLLDSRSAPISPRAELALMFAARAQHIEEVIAPALAAGRTVICDRFTDSSEAYQGCARGLGSELVLALHRHLCAALMPDATVLLTFADPVQSLARARRRNAAAARDESRFEAEGEAFQRRVVQGYDAIADREPGRVHRVDAGRSVDEVHQAVVAALAPLLEKHLQAP